MAFTPSANKHHQSLRPAPVQQKGRTLRTRATGLCAAAVLLAVAWQAWGSGMPNSATSLVQQSTGAMKRKQCANVTAAGTVSKRTKTDLPDYIKFFFSRSKENDDLGLGILDWAKRLSNFWPSTIRIDGREYPSVEHYFHSEKAKCSTCPGMAQAL